jgi:hypothetical protein
MFKHWLPLFNGTNAKISDTQVEGMTKMVTRRQSENSYRLRHCELWSVTENVKTTVAEEARAQTHTVRGQISRGDSAGAGPKASEEKTTTESPSTYSNEAERHE